MNEVMSFRRNSQPVRKWNDWLDAHRDVLATTGVPCGVYEQEDYWLYFLEHGAFPGEGAAPAFDIDELTGDEALRLLAFLRTHAQIQHSVTQRYLERTYTANENTRNA